MKNSVLILVVVSLAFQWAFAAENLIHRMPPFHMRPETGSAGDAIAFFWKGQYHVFYLHDRKWEHTVSTNLLHWRELPTALSPSSDPVGPDMACWTGSIIEHDGTFYLFYTGQNPKDPINDQKVMLATS